MLKKTIFILSVPLVTNLAYAETFSWQKCIELTYKNNAELSGADANLKSSVYQKKAVRGDFMPKVSASLGFAEQKIERNTTNFFNSNNNNNGQSYSASLDASVNLFSGLKDYSRLGQAEAAIEASNAKYVTTKAKISFDLKSGFENLAYAKEYQKLTAEIIRRRSENSKIVELRFEGGLENKGSLLLSKAYLSQAEYDALQAINLERTSRSQLAKSMGLDEYEEFDIAGSIPVYEPPATAPDLNELAKSTPEFLEARALESSSEKGIQVAKSNFYPSLNLNGSLKKIGEDYFPEDSKQTTVGLSLTIPLFDGGKDYYGTKSAVESYVSSKSNRLTVSRNLIVKLQQQYSGLIESVAKLKADTLFKEAAETRANIARNKYNNGLLTFEDWDVIESDLISRQKSYLQSRRDRVIAQASWEQTLGKGIDL